MLRECTYILPTLYHDVCFRIGQSGYPPRTSSAIAAIFQNLDQSGHLTLLTECLHEMVERLRRVEISARMNLPRLGRSVVGYNPSKPELFPRQQLSHVWNLSGIDSNQGITCSDPVLSVLDEASWMLDDSSDRLIFGLNMFHYFRRALAQYCSTYPDAALFVVMVDTSAKIQVFAPHLGREYYA